MTFSEFKKNFGPWWSIWKFALLPVINALVSVVCYWIGILHSDHCDSMYLQRSGAVATTAALLFALYDHKQSLQLSEERALYKFEQITKHFPLTGASSLKDIHVRLKKNTTMINWFVRILNAVVLAVATLVWGFGDLAKNYMVITFTCAHGS